MSCQSHLESGQQLVCPLSLAEVTSWIIELICNNLPGMLKQQAVVCTVLTSWPFFSVFQALNKLGVVHYPVNVRVSYEQPCAGAQSNA